MPDKKEWEKSPPQHSVYKLNFQETPSRPIKEQIIKRPKTSFDTDVPITTSYRYSHGTSNPSRELLSAMSNTGLTTVPNRRLTTQGSGRESVAHCLNWYAPPTKSAPTTAPARPNRPLIPAATEPVTLVPHPPAKARPCTAQTTPTVVCQPTQAPPMPAPPESAKVKLALTE